MARRKNVKRIDPRYFMDEKMERLDEQEEAPSAPQLDEKEVLPLVQNFYKAMHTARDNVQSSRKAYGDDWVKKKTQALSQKANAENELEFWFQRTVGDAMWGAARAMAPVYDAVRKGWKGSANSIDVIVHSAGDVAEKFLQQKDMKAKMAFLNQWDELTKEYFERTERFGKGHII